MPNNALSIPDIPIQSNAPPIEQSIKFDADVNDFLTEFQKGRGDLHHTVNSIIRVYRDCLSPNKRGALEAKDGKSPQQNGVQGKLSELKKTSNG